MKKILKAIAVSCIAVMFLIPNVAVAAEREQPEWEDIVLSQEEFEEALSNNPNNEIQPYTSGLIVAYHISVSKEGMGTLVITGKTIGSNDVVKCGFKKVLVQIRPSNNPNWSDFSIYSDLYNDAGIYVLSKQIVVPKGYQYRVVCTHYAKKNILQTEKIDNTSNVVTF